jgi:glycosyltransferase involved in cell wall biosynthesis
VKVIQILPELNAGGVERGTCEVAAHLIRNGHEALVISHGGRLVGELDAMGARHITMPVHRKSLKTLFQVSKMRALLETEKPDIIHIRSRVPGWVTWLAWRKMNPQNRPHLVSTVHGFYSVNAYSAVMTRGERVIAVSASVRDYILKNYPKTDPNIIRVIHRGVDDTTYTPTYAPSESWNKAWTEAHPEVAGRIPLLLPGRLTRWKGQVDFIQMIARLLKQNLPVQGIIAGEPHPKKIAFLDELRQLASSLGIADRISFVGHRSDLRDVMAISRIVYSLSLDPEAFGRVSLEAMALGKPVIGYAHGGVAEQLQVVFPDGLIPVGDIAAAESTTIHILESGSTPASIGHFSLKKMLDATLDTYREITNTKQLR